MANNRIYVKPEDGKKIPDPVRRGFLPKEGGYVDPTDIYWQRRLNDEDVKKSAPPKQEKPKT